MVNPKAKILYVSPNGYLGGAEKFVLTACAAHRERGNFDVAILFYRNGEAVELARKKGIPFFVLGSAFRLRNPLSLIRALKEIRACVHAFSPQIVHLTMPYAHITFSLATIGIKIKKIWFQHGPVGGLLDRIANFFPVHRIWYNSRYLKNQHHLTRPRACVRMSEDIIPLGIEAPSVVRPHFNGDTLVLGMAGRISPLKGIHQVIEVLGRLKREHASIRPFRLKIAGSAKLREDQEYFHSLRVLVRDQQLDKEVEFTGHVDDMNAFYDTLDVFIHAPIVPEGFGLVIAEAMARGILVIGPQEGGSEDFLIHNQSGITFGDLEKTLAFVLKPGEFTSPHFTHLRTAGKELITSRYSVKSMMDRMEFLYRSSLPPWHPLHYLPPEAESILDVGCNTGAALAHAHELGIQKLFGIEINLQALQTASDRLKKIANADRIELHHGSASRLPFSTGKIDVVTCLEVLEHVPEKQRKDTLREIHRVLVPDGRLILTVPAKGLFSFLDPANFRLLFPKLFHSLSRLVGGKGREAGYENQEHGIVWHHHFKLQEIRSLLEPQFEIETVRWRGALLAPLTNWLKFPFYRRNLGENPVVKFLDSVENMEMSLPLGAFLAYNLLIVARRRESPTL